MTRRGLAALAILCAAPAAAEDLVTAREFEALSTGNTLIFERLGQVYGAEQYLPGRQVIWQYADGSCTHGEWYADGTDLCFIYENSTAAQCWVFSRRDGDFFARERGVTLGALSELRLMEKTEEPLECQGPDLGV